MRLGKEAGRTSLRSFRVLWLLLALGLTGTLSMSIAPIEQLLPPDVDVPRMLLLVQPALFASGAALLGWWAAPQVGLSTPLLSAIATGGDARTPLRRALVPTLLAALFGGLCIGAFGFVADPFLAGQAQAIEIPLLTRVLYGGTVEELIFRWGMMAGLALALSRFVNRAAALWIAGVAAALLFAAGHVPGLMISAPGAPLWLPAAAMLANTLIGLVLAWLTMRRGLEAAMVAHGLSHVASLPLLALVG